MNKQLLRTLGLGDYVERIEQGKCPFCEKEITAKDLAAYPEINRREFEISGLCFECQEKWFEKEKKSE